MSLWWTLVHCSHVRLPARIALSDRTNEVSLPVTLDPINTHPMTVRLVEAISSVIMATGSSALAQKRIQ